MNEDKIKNLFKSDDSTPQKPSHEWPTILNKMEERKLSFRFFPAIAATMCLVTLTIIGMSLRPNFQQMYDDELGEYLFSNSYFEEETLSFYTEI